MRLPRLGERPGHSATTAHFQAAYPFVAEGGLGAPGAYIGRDAYGGAWLYDPWALYERGRWPGRTCSWSARSASPSPPS